MKNKVLLFFICFMFIFLVIGLGSALLCIGSDGYYHDCSNNGDSYRKMPVKTAVQNYNSGYYEGEYEGRKSGYKKGYSRGYDKGYDERRKEDLSRRKRESSFGNFRVINHRVSPYFYYPNSYRYYPSYSYGYSGRSYVGSSYYGSGYNYNNLLYRPYNSFGGFGGFGGYGY